MSERKRKHGSKVDDDALMPSTTQRMKTVNYELSLPRSRLIPFSSHSLTSDSTKPKEVNVALKLCEPQHIH